MTDIRVHAILRCGCLAVLVLCGLALSAQNSDTPSSIGDSYLITNAYIHTAPGTPVAMGSVAIDNGLITAVGPALTPAFDAQVIDADSMHLYAGFIAAMTHAGVEELSEDEDREVSNPGLPGYERAGIQPARLASSMLEGNSAFNAFREAGYTMLHVAPHGRMLPGQSAVVTTGDVTYASQRVFRDGVAQYAQLKGAGGVYPNTVIAVMSKMRELYRNAELHDAYVGKYDRDPEGKAPPAADPVIEALVSATRSTQPIYYRADGVKDIYRVIELHRELGFDLVLAECKEAYKAMDEVSQLDRPVLISLDMPAKPDDIDSSDVQLVPWQSRRFAAYSEAVAQAYVLDSLGIAFSFSYLKTKPNKVHPTLATMVEAGLPAEALLAALTTTPAELLGLDKVAGTISRGKLAHLVLMDKPLGDPVAKARQVWVGGQTYKIKAAPPKAKGTADEDLDLIGTWSYNIDIPADPQTGTMVFSKDGDSYSVLIYDEQDQDDPENVDDINISGSTVTFPLTVDSDGTQLELSFSLDFDGDTYEGTIIISPFGTFPITGKKKPN